MKLGCYFQGGNFFFPVSEAEAEAEAEAEEAEAAGVAPSPFPFKLCKLGKKAKKQKLVFLRDIFKIHFFLALWGRAKFL